MSRILLVEDNVNLAAGLRMSLDGEGFEVVHVVSGDAAMRRVASDGFALVVLDIMMPGRLDGFDVLQQLRDGGWGMPVLILSARGEQADKVEGFRRGADDYVTKPFGVLELVARVHALLRRAGHGGPTATPSQTPIRCGDLEVWPGTHMVFRNGRMVRLRPKEYELLLLLMRHSGQVIRREEMLRDVFGYRAGVYSRTLDTHIADLRRKIESDPRSPRHIITVHRIGYRFE